VRYRRRRCGPGSDPVIDLPGFVGTAARAAGAEVQKLRIGQPRSVNDHTTVWRIRVNVNHTGVSTIERS
jgi:hypothetical protein